MRPLCILKEHSFSDENKPAVYLPFSPLQPLLPFSPIGPGVPGLPSLPGLPLGPQGPRQKTNTVLNGSYRIKCTVANYLSLPRIFPISAMKVLQTELQTHWDSWSSAFYTIKTKLGTYEITWQFEIVLPF